MKKQHVLLLFLAALAGTALMTAVAEQRTDTQRQTAQIQGRLLEEGTRKPLAGGVNWTAGRKPGTPPENDVVEVDESGMFLLRDLPRGPIALVGWSAGYGQAFAFLMTDSEGVHEVELLLPIAAAVEGTVVDGQGYPVSDASVRVQYLERFRDRLSGGRAKAMADGARAEGFRISIREAVTTGGWPNTSASEGKDVGVFRILGIDPSRPFQLIVTHEQFGDLESEPLTLAPGQELKGVLLKY